MWGHRRGSGWSAVERGVRSLCKSHHTTGVLGFQSPGRFFRPHVGFGMGVKGQGRPASDLLARRQSWGAAGLVRARETAVLGSIAKSQSLGTDFEEETAGKQALAAYYESHEKIRAAEHEKQIAAARRRRWELQAQAGRLLPGERVAKCLRWVGFDAEAGQAYSSVLVMYAAKIRRAHYKNLMVCSSVWHCPLCAAKISERRRLELVAAVDASAYQPVLVSVTLQHQLADSLRGSLDALLGAWCSLKSGKSWQAFKAEHGIVGTVRALEVTYGSSGWHPHLHILFFARPGVDVSALSAALKLRWIAHLKKFSRTASLAHGVDVRSANSDVADYVAKWGREPVDKLRPAAWSVESELTKSGSKFARGESSSMLGLLDRFADGDVEAGELWKMYAREFKGKRQLVWSAGLRELLGLCKELSDEELAALEVEEALLLATLSRQTWRGVLGNDARGELLEVASKGDAALLWAWLHRLGIRYQ